MNKEIQDAITLLESNGYEVTPPQSIEILDEEFEQWWSTYAYKKERKKTLEKWRKLSTKDRNACIRATPSYVANTIIPGQSTKKNDKRQFRAYPLTYLNGKRWEDEIYPEYDESTIQQQQTELAFARTAAKVFESD